ncbi:hypothetical protein GGS24DRAFT_473330 [Hypoxylon argillaceum]|nr:hypothetical protein GGS24DRAFT_473330 [Hypoxylon argillaceum]
MVLVLVLVLGGTPSKKPTQCFEPRSVSAKVESDLLHLSEDWDSSRGLPASILTHRYIRIQSSQTKLLPHPSDECRSNSG